MSEMYRRQFLAASALTLLSTAGCISSASEPTLVGEAIEHDALVVSVPRVEVVETLDATGPDGTDTFRRDGALFVTPWIQIENTGDVSHGLPSPLGDVEVRYQNSRANYVGGRHDEITIGDETYRTYRLEHRDRNGSLSPAGVIAGLGSVYQLPADYDPEEAAVQISVDNADYVWVFQGEETA